MSYSLYTVGHSNHNLAHFLSLLKHHEITAIADVRSHPFSRYCPHFNQSKLKNELVKHKIAYSFLGRELGARSDDGSCYDQNGQVQYGKLAETEEFRLGVQRLIEGSATYRIALMCAEREPLECHRTLLVSQELAKHRFEVHHIHSDNSLETHEAALRRLLTMFGLGDGNLFVSEQDRIREACRLQERKIAYRREAPMMSQSSR